MQSHETSNNLNHQSISEAQTTGGSALPGEIRSLQFWKANACKRRASANHCCSSFLFHNAQVCRTRWLTWHSVGIAEPDALAAPSVSASCLENVWNVFYYVLLLSDSFLSSLRKAIPRFSPSPSALKQLGLLFCLMTKNDVAKLIPANPVRIRQSTTWQLCRPAVFTQRQS